MTRSIGGRARQYTRVTRTRPPRAPAATFAVSPYLETWPNDGLVGTAVTDLDWNILSTATPGGLTIAGGVLAPAGFSDAFYGRAEHDTATTDQYVQTDWTAGTSNAEIYLFARCGDSDQINNDQAVFLFVYTPDGVGTEASIDNWAGSGTALTDGGVLVGVSPIATWRLEVEGTTARCLRNGLEIFSGSIAGFSPQPAGTRGGLACEFGANDVAVDNFEVFDL